MSRSSLLTTAVAVGELQLRLMEGCNEREIRFPISQFRANPTWLTLRWIYLITSCKLYWHPQLYLIIRALEVCGYQVPIVADTRVDVYCVRG